MGAESAKSIAISVIQPYWGGNFGGELKDEVLLIEFMGTNKNQWNTLGAAVIKADLKNKYNLDVSAEALNKCETFGNLISAVEEAKIVGLSQLIKRRILDGVSCDLAN